MIVNMYIKIQLHEMEIVLVKVKYVDTSALKIKIQ